MKSQKVAILLNSSWNIVNFRAGLLRTLHEAGYELLALSPTDSYESQLPALNCAHIEVSMRAVGINPLADLFLLAKLWLVMWREKPDVILTYTIKPNIYGNMAARLLGIPVIANVAGLGAAFAKDGWLQGTVTKLFTIALARASVVFFQNEEDRAFFIGKGMVRATSTARLPGSGVDLMHFTPNPVENQPPSRHLTFILIARLLRDKGIHDYVEAARLVRIDYPQTRFQIVGFIDKDNPDSIDDAELQCWMQEQVIEYLGRSDDVRVPLSQADCMVLPSYYREGVPRVLLEAAAMALPIITCDTVGCRDAVDDGITGWLCPPKSPKILAERMKQLVALPRHERLAMGNQGRKKMGREFKESLVIDKYLAAIRQHAR